MNWYYADELDQQHECGEDGLPGLVEKGTVSQTTLVWNETMSDWKPAGEVLPKLFSSDETSSADFSPTESQPPALSRVQAKQVSSPIPSAPVRTTPATDPLAVIALVLGVLGVLCFQLFGIGGIICGHIAYNKAVREGVPSPNKGLALAGIITGYVSLLLLVVIMIFYGGAMFMGMKETSLETPTIEASPSFETL